MTIDIGPSAARLLARLSAPGSRLLSHCFRSFAFMFVAATFLLLPVAGQIVDTAFAFKYDRYAQTDESTITSTGFILSASVRFADAISVVPSQSLIAGFALASTNLSESGQSFGGETWSYLNRALLNAAVPNGEIHFQLPPPASFDAGVELAGDRYPEAARVSNYAALQTVSDATSVVTWPRIATVAGDSIVVSIASEHGEELYTTSAVNAAGVADETATSASIPVPPGLTSFGTVTVLRQTSSAQAGAAQLIAGYATSTTFLVRSVASKDTTPPLSLVQSPALDAVGVSPEATVDLAFDKPMRKRGLLRGVSAPPGKRQRLEWSPDQKSVRIHFPSPLPAGPVTLLFDDDVRGQSFQDLSQNRIAADTTAARFFVGNLPAFVRQPESSTPTLGSTVTLTANAIWPPGGLGYQWFRDGSAIPGATGATLSLPNFQFAQGGIYELAAANSNGSVLSGPAFVAIDTFTLYPRGTLLELGDPSTLGALTPGLPFTLKLVPAGGAATKIQWRKNGLPIPGVVGLSLVFSQLQENDTGLYDVVLSNEYGTAATQTCCLTVRAGSPLPTYPVTREDWVIRAGNEVELSPRIGPAYGFLRGWEFNGHPIATDPAERFLRIPRPTVADSGVYRYWVSNGLERVLVAEETLTVRNPPTSPVPAGLYPDIWVTEDDPAYVMATFDSDVSWTTQWRRNGSDLPGQTSAMLAIERNRPELAGTYVCVARNVYGTGETPSFNVRFQSAHVPPEKPAITAHSPVLLMPGNEVMLDSRTDVSVVHANHFEWRRNGVLVGGDSSVLHIYSATAADTGDYTVTYVNPYGSTASDSVNVRVLDAAQPPIVLGAKATVVADLGASASLNARLLGVGPLHCRWFVNDREVTAENGTKAAGNFDIPSVQPYHAGTWSLEVANDAGTVTVPIAELAIRPLPVSSSRLVNVSTRAKAGVGAEMLIVGFGLSGTAPKQMLVRALGPALGRVGVSAPARNPRLVVYRGNTIVASNDDWYRQTGTAAIVAAQRESQAFPLAVGDADAAVLVTLDPGSYTLQYVPGIADANTVGLIEAYDVDPGYAPTRLTNISCRLFVGSGQQAAIPGFVVNGTGPRTYLVRAVGPGLEKYGVGGVLADPQVKLAPIGISAVSFANDDWEAAPNAAAIVQAAERVGAFALAPGSKDAALLVTLPPGGYTALVSGVGNSSGVALVEIYELSQ